MQNIEDVEKRFSEECSNLMQYIIHSIISYCRNNSFCIDGVTDDEETKELLEQYEYNFVDEITEDKNQKIIEKLYPEGLSGLRMIPFRSVGCSKGILPGYPVAELTIEAEGEKISPGQVYIGVSENILSVQGSYQILLHPALLKKR